MRIVTYRNGKSKGLAYVDFEDEQSASKALIQTDGMLIGDFQISVAISNPPKKNKESSSAPSRESLARSLGSGSVSSRGGESALSSSSSSATAPLVRTGFLPRALVGRKKALNI